MESMVEKVAQAIEDNVSAGLPAGVTVDWRYAAVAAIEAMREPMSEMVEIGTKARWQSAVRDADSVREIWTHMIGAALKEQEKVG